MKESSVFVWHPLGMPEDGCSIVTPAIRTGGLIVMNRELRPSLYWLTDQNQV
jgi:hypothetical protein